MKCTKCDGSGKAGDVQLSNPPKFPNCPFCDGTGEVALGFEVVDMPDGEKSILVSDKHPVLICDRCKAEVLHLEFVDDQAICLKCAYAPKPLPWTRERPTKPGWYWLYYPGMRVMAVELIKDDFIHGYPVDIWVGRFEGFLWQGPITPQGEPTEEGS